ncbi:MAG: CPBP family glutamic-type intramembrane protease [Alphaproteobacteria bacterium]
MRHPVIWAEFIIVYIGLPTALALMHVHRPVLYLALWIMTLSGLLVLKRCYGLNWKSLWHGQGWSEAQKKAALLRFFGLSILAATFMYFFFPAYFLGFPRQKPAMWAAVILLYPILSVIAQEFIFRSYFFRRYATLFPHPTWMFAVNVLAFGYLHIVLHNWVAPVLSVFGSILFTASYSQHQSLKWVSIEHAAYGCMIFTLGYGWFFFYGIKM